MENKHEILLGLTTTNPSDYEWKINEVKKFEIKKIALFPTALGLEDRKHLYESLEKSGIEEIPHVHLRGEDMEKWELEMFENRYKTSLFNIHQTDIDQPVIQPYLNKIYIENQFAPFDEKSLAKCAGICLDVSHAEDGRLWKNSFCDPMENGILDRHPIGCCHVSAVYFKKDMPINDLTEVSRHTLKNLDEINYVAKYKNYLPYYISLELENSFEQQLKIKEYLEKIVN